MRLTVYLRILLTCNLDPWPRIYKHFAIRDSQLVKGRPNAANALECHWSSTQQPESNVSNGKDLGPLLPPCEHLVWNQFIEPQEAEDGTLSGLLKAARKHCLGQGQLQVNVLVLERAKPCNWYTDVNPHFTSGCWSQVHQDSRPDQFRWETHVTQTLYRYPWTQEGRQTYTQWCHRETAQHQF